MDLITTHLDGHVLQIGLNRVAKRNAFSWAMLQQLAEAFTQLEEDKQARCALLYAEGDHFTAGLDLADVAPHIQSGEPLFPENKVDPLQVYGLARTKPVVIAVQGYCLTIGIELILACDIAIAARDTRFGQIEILRGIFPFGGATLRFPQRSGWGNAMRYLLTGELFDAQEACRIGLVQEMVDTDARSRGLDIARTIAEQAPLGVAATLVNARKALEEGFHGAQADLMPTIRELMKTEDAAEGLMSFLERRKAQFKGK